MNYELAKELKDAGFPHKCDKHGGNDGYDEYCQYQDWDKEIGYICIPHLSELIEACGNDFANLKSFSHDWSAEAMRDEFTEGNGSTPEEAVARLWLALNKNNELL